MLKNASIYVKSVLFVFVIMISSSTLTMFFWVLSRHLFTSDRTPRLAVLMPVIALAVSTILGAGISYILSKKTLKPVRDLIQANRRIAKGDFSVRVTVSMSGEIRELFHSFNRMAAELSGIEMFHADFINSFSHECKTPIVSIRGFAKQLESADITPEQRAEYIRIIIEESERLTKLANNVLQISKFDNQRILTNQSDFRLDEQIRDCILLLEKNWNEKNLQWDLELEEITYCGNEEILSQAWLNLLDNAIKFSASDSSISIFLTQAGSEVLIRIKDQGIGMPENTLKHIFDKFYQGDPAHASQGSGLGLSLVLRIIELSGGRIVVESEENNGTEFLVYLPKENNSTVEI